MPPITWKSEKFKHVCMFQNPVFCQEKLLKHTRWRLNFYTEIWECMYVCLRHESVCMYVWDIHTYMLSCLRHTYIHAWRSQTYIRTCLEVSDIHTYSLFARRINIDLNSCAPNFKKVWAAILLKQNGLFLKGNSHFLSKAGSDGF